MPSKGMGCQDHKWQNVFYFSFFVPLAPGAGMERQLTFEHVFSAGVCALGLILEESLLPCVEDGEVLNS